MKTINSMYAGRSLLLHFYTQVPPPSAHSLAGYSCLEGVTSSSLISVVIIVVNVHVWCTKMIILKVVYFSSCTGGFILIDHLKVNITGS